MRRAYIFVYNNQVGTRDTVREVLDDIPEILNWRYELPYCYFLVSELSAEELYKRIKAKAATPDGRFIVSEVTANKQGWLNEKSWRVMNEKPDAGK